MIRKIKKLLLYSGCQRQDSVNLRPWFTFYIIYLVFLAAVAVLSLKYYDQSTSNLALTGWLIALYLFYLSLCCTFCPAPTAWMVLLMASPIIQLVKPQILTNILPFSAPPTDNLIIITTILLVASLGALASALANLNEYHIFTYLLRCHKVREIRQTRLYHTTARYFDVGPFSLITLFSFLPLPVDVVRWLAITHCYRRDYYFLANFVGRFFRYAILAATACFFQLGWFGIAAIQLGLIALIMLRYIPKLLSYKKKDASSQILTNTETPALAPVTEKNPTKGMSS
ncbi:MAG: hypothetical protein GY869_16755 [Planctomycetes bacterium]|nr:hypothetical protein [Planctomycetota bacterium]